MYRNQTNTMTSINLQKTRNDDYKVAMHYACGNVSVLKIYSGRGVTKMNV